MDLFKKYIYSDVNFLTNRLCASHCIYLGQPVLEKFWTIASIADKQVIFSTGIEPGYFNAKQLDVIK